MKHYKSEGELSKIKNYWEIRETNADGDILQFEHLRIQEMVPFKEYMISTHHTPMGTVLETSKMQEITPEEYNHARSKILETLEAARVP